MQNFILSLFLISFSLAETYSWEDGGTILGSYGNLANVENVGETDGVVPYDGDYMLTVSESPIDGTPQAFIAWVTDISEGDQITACFYGYDTTAGSSPSMRVWGRSTCSIIGPTPMRSSPASRSTSRRTCRSTLDTCALIAALCSIR